jgi:transcriptional regulator with XRE-family HTH domain
MTADQVRARLEKACESMGSQSAFARQHGLTRAYISAVLKGKKRPGKSILIALGIKADFIYSMGR